MDTTDKVLEIPVVEGLEFDDATHTYRLDGLVIPSVSAILGPLSKAKYAGISERTMDRAADKGTAVHNSIENWIKFEIEDIPPEHIGYFNAFRAWWDEFRPEVVGSEVRICHRLMRYGGTADSSSVPAFPAQEPAAAWKDSAKNLPPPGSGTHSFSS